MSKKWYQKVTIQAALIGVGGLVFVTFLAALLDLPWRETSSPNVEPNPVDEEGYVFVSGSGETENYLLGQEGNYPVAETEINRRPKLWMTYAWEDNSGGNFDFLIAELEGAGVDATFDKIALVPGKRLWEQIADRIEDPELDGWAILLTEESIKSAACMEELAYALDQALHREDFPLLGLVHQVSIEEVPAALRVRLLIDLRNSGWPEQVLAGLRGTPPDKATESPTRYMWESLPGFRGDKTLAIHLKPRFEELRYWRFIYPIDANRIDWGHGPPQKTGFTGSKSNSFNVDGVGRGTYQGERVTWVGSNGDVVTPGGGCYIVFGEPLPKFIGFGVADEPSGMPSTIEYVLLN